MDVTKSIIKSLNGYIFNLSEKISQEHNIPIEEILNVWCDQQNISFTNVFLPMIKISKKQKKQDQSIAFETLTEDNNITSPPFSSNDEIINEESSLSSTTLVNNIKNSEKQESKLCEYIFTRGPKKDKQCTIMAKSGNLCSKHKNSK